MALIVDLQQFLASSTGRNPKLLPPGVGADARNLDTAEGDFRGLRQPQSVHTLVGYGGVQQHALYRMGRETASDTQYWLAFAADVDFARSMLASDPTERTYGTGGNFGVPSFTDNTFLGAPPYPTGSYSMGVPAPGAGLSAALGTAGSGNDETRTYVSTFLRPAPNYDEGAPSLPVTITVKAGSTVDLTGLPAAPGGYGITLRRVYVSTGGDFREVAELPEATTSLTDTGTRGNILQSGGSTTKPAWLMPPANMKGLIELWSGMHGAFDEKSYLTCVPYKPHAWPDEFRRKVPDRIVGTAKWGQQWLLATTGIPRVVMGTTPMAMADSPIYFRQACVSKRSVKGVGHGVVWASNAGLCYHGQRGTFVLTEGILTRAQWRALVPETIIGAVWGPWYFGFFNDGTRKGFMINHEKPDGVIWIDYGAYAVFEDSITDSLYFLVEGNFIHKWDVGGGALANASFTSKVYRRPVATCAGAARIVASGYPVLFSMWADGVAKVVNRSIESDEPFRLPDGYTAEEFQVRIFGPGPVEGVFVGEEMADLP
jgi:hypothetical protein